MDRTFATMLARCGLGLAVAGCAAVSTPRPAVTWAQHHGSTPRHSEV